MQPCPPVQAIGLRVRECTLCHLSKTRTNAVPGSGKPNADIMFIGEAPGRNEDLQGMPFVGAAGGVLSSALSRAGIGREEVYITNVVKCRPPDNRVPLQAERDACRVHLENEISAVDPSVICVMGNTAFGSLLGGGNITKSRGMVFSKGGRIYAICVHPAAVIYNSALATVLDADIAKVVRLRNDIRSGADIRVDRHV